MTVSHVNAVHRSRACGPLGLALDSTEFSGTIVAAESSHHQGVQERDRQFQQLVDAHYLPLYRFAMSLTRSESNACDLVQDTFLIWATRGHQLRDARKVKSWLFTTLHRKFLESQRRVVRFPHLELEEAEADLPAVEPGLENHLDARAVLDLLGQVDAQFQSAVALFYLEDCPYNEIAEILEVPLGTVKSRIARGLAQLRALVGRRHPVQIKREGKDS
jgi:RNA polymerase sigma factor (sigma-70 family)